MEILIVIWDAFCHDVAQMPHNLLTPCISLPVFTGLVWRLKGYWKPLAISLMAMGWGGIFYGIAGLVRLSSLFVDAIQVANWNWAWIPTIMMHLIEFLLGLGLYHWMIKKRY